MALLLLSVQAARQEMVAVQRCLNQRPGHLSNRTPRMLEKSFIFHNDMNVTSNVKHPSCVLSIAVRSTRAGIFCRALPRVITRLIMIIEEPAPENCFRSGWPKYAQHLSN